MGGEIRAVEVTITTVDRQQFPCAGGPEAWSYDDVSDSLLDAIQAAVTAWHSTIGAGYLRCPPEVL